MRAHRARDHDLPLPLLHPHAQARAHRRRRHQGCHASHRRRALRRVLPPRARVRLAALRRLVDRRRYLHLLLGRDQAADVHVGGWQIPDEVLRRHHQCAQRQLPLRVRICHGRVSAVYSLVPPVRPPVDHAVLPGDDDAHPRVRVCHLLLPRRFVRHLPIGLAEHPRDSGISQDVVVPHRVRGVWLVTRRHPPVYSHHRRVHGAPAQEGWQGQRAGQVRRVLRPVLPVVPAEDHRVDQSEHVHPHRHRGQVVLRVRDGGAVVDLQQPRNRGSRQRHRRRPPLPRQALRVPHVRSSRVPLPRRRRLHDGREQSFLPAAHRRLLHHLRVRHRGSVHVRRGDGDRHHAPVVLQGLQAARRQAAVRAAAAGIRAREVRDQG